MKLLECINRIYLRGCEKAYLGQLVDTDEFCPKRDTTAQKGSGTLVMHIRSGDIFQPNGQGSHRQGFGQVFDKTDKYRTLLEILAVGHLTILKSIVCVTHCATSWTYRCERHPNTLRTFVNQIFQRVMSQPCFVVSTTRVIIFTNTMLEHLTALVTALGETMTKNLGKACKWWKTD